MQVQKTPETFNTLKTILKIKRLAYNFDVDIIVGTLNCGFIFTPQSLLFLNEDEFLGKQTLRRRHVQRRPPKS